MPARDQPPASSGLAALVAAALAACGSVGDPLPPLLNLPEPVSDLTAVQVADELEVSWTWPARTTEGQTARRIGGFALWAVDVPAFGRELTAETIDQYRRPVARIGPEELSSRGPGDRLELRLPLVGWKLGQLALLAVTVASPAGRHAGYSNQARLHPMEPPAVVDWSDRRVEPGGVALAWKPARHADEYTLERAEGEGPFVVLGRVVGTSFLDRGVRWGETYGYRIRPIRQSAAGWIRGHFSPVATVTATDRFPPRAPQSLRAVRAPASIELSWLASTEADLAGYVVYRNGEVLADLIPQAMFSDQDAPRNAALEYAVTAVDDAGNESETSEPLLVPAGP